MTEKSTERKTKLLWCDQCGGNFCTKGYLEKTPDYCRAVEDPETIESIKEKYFDPENARINLATSELLNRQKTEGIFMPRIQEAIEFARALKVTKVGIAVCASMLWEGAEFARLMRKAGLEPCTVNCMAGGIKHEDMGVPKEWVIPDCNPIIQAEILNREGTDLNYIYGLCMGHDTLFTRHSKAPVTTVVVKDRVTVNNPGAVLFSFYHRSRLWAEYGGDPDEWKQIK